MNQKFSVLLSTYHGDSSNQLQRSIESVFEQTIQPAEVVIIEDGPLPDELQKTLATFSSKYPQIVRRINLPENQGLGMALRRGVQECSHELVARMDTDDISVHDRFEKQLSYFELHPETDVLGGYIAEFKTDPANLTHIRSVPTSPEEVRSKARFRSPLNHPSVMFRKQAVLDAGNYADLRSMQDYELWMRMLSQGYTIANIPEVLVKCEAGKKLYGRRGGLKYARLDFMLQRQFLQMGMISTPIFLLNLCVRIPIRLVPNTIRGFVYSYILRN